MEKITLVGILRGCGLGVLRGPIPPSDRAVFTRANIFDPEAGQLRRALVHASSQYACEQKYTRERCRTNNSI